MSTAAQLSIRLLASNIPRDVTPECFYDHLRAFFCSPWESAADGSAGGTTDDLLTNALLLTSSPQGSSDACESTSTAVNAGVAFVDVRGGAVAHALADGRLVCEVGERALQWRVVGPVHPREASTDGTRGHLGAELERRGRDAYAHTRQRVHTTCSSLDDVAGPVPQRIIADGSGIEEDVIRLRAISVEDVHAVYGSAPPAATDSEGVVSLPVTAVFDSPASVDDAGRTATPLSSAESGSHHTLLSLYTDFDDALHRLMRDVRWPNTGTPPAEDIGDPRAHHILCLQWLSTGEAQIRVPHRVAQALRQRCEGAPLTVTHLRDVRTECMPTPETGASKASPGLLSAPFVTATISPARTLWSLQRTPRRCLGDFLLSPFPDVESGGTRHHASAHRSRLEPAPTVVIPRRGVVSPPVKRRRDELASPVPFSDLPSQEAAAAATASPERHQWRLATKADLLKAVAVALDATSGRAGALRDEYGNLFFPPPDSPLW